MMKDKISQRLKRVSIKSIVWSHWNEGSWFQIKSRQCYQIYRPSNPLWSFLFFSFFFFDCNFYLIFLFDYIFTFCLLFWALILLYLFPSTLWGSLLCRLPPQRQPSVRSAPLSAGGISKNNPRIGQVISRKSVRCVGGDVALSSLLSSSRVLFTMGRCWEKYGRLPKERLVKKKQLQSESAAS
jgi:hypothetical protein